MWCLISFVTQSGHWQAVSLLEHSTNALFGAHRFSDSNLILSLSVVHDKGLFTDRHVFVGIESLLADVRMRPLRSALGIQAEGRVEVLDAIGFVRTLSIFRVVDLDRGLPFSLFRIRSSEMLSRAGREDGMWLVNVRLWSTNVFPFRSELS